ncbi:MAG: hypothetical protein H0W58_08440 [Acidobacteria bacterium]|nr:hypothetical protein [Acidobacteriota bacterium]
MIHDVSEWLKWLKHRISDGFERSIDALLNFLECCPHENLIPRRKKFRLENNDE